MNTRHVHHMYTSYKNLSKASTVSKYEITKDTVTIRFTDNSVYVYSNQSADPVNIAKMKTLAVAGKGLGTFIEANVKNRFMRKVR